MSEFPALEGLGNRIMICGPSNAGKSTLAVALGRRLGVPHIHLDQFYHAPGSDWVPRPREEFVALHHDAIERDTWVMDGNYSGLIPSRIERTTGTIFVRTNRLSSLARYFRRTLLERDRLGGLEGKGDSIKWNMIHFILFLSPPKQRMTNNTPSAAGLPYLEVRAMDQLNRLYAEWGLTRK